MNDFNEIFEIGKTIQTLVSLMDAGFSIPINQVEDLNDNSKLVMCLNEYVADCGRFKENFCIDKRMSKVFSDLYISEGDAQKYTVENNGLAYLINKLTEKLSGIAHDYKWNFEEVAIEVSEETEA